MKKIEEIIETLKDVLSGNTKNGDGYMYDKHVAEALGITQMNLKNMRKRDKIPYREIMDFCAKRRININSVLYGQKLSDITEITNNIMFNKLIKKNRK